jgi:DNA-binding NarL/FixJ family response regulator
VSPSPTVLLVDDEPIFLELTQERFRRDARLVVVGQAASGTEALALAEQLRPDVVVLDVLMPGLSGYETARRLRALLPETKVVLTSADSSVYFSAEVRAVGAVAFIDKKDLDPDALLEALAAGG